MEDDKKGAGDVANVGVPSHPHQQVKFTFRGHPPAAPTPTTASASVQPPALTPDSTSALRAQHEPMNATTNGTSRQLSNVSGASGTGDTNGGETITGNQVKPKKEEMAEVEDGSAKKESLETTQGNGRDGIDKYEASSSTPVLASSSTIEPSPAPESTQHEPTPLSPNSASEDPSRVGSPIPREATPALSEAPSDAASVDTNFAFPPPETSAFELAHPLSAYQFSNTTLVPVASTSTNPFNFVSWPPQPLEDSWTRTRLPDDDEAYLELDREAGYLATPEEIEASRISREEKQAKIQAKIAAAKIKGKGKEVTARTSTKPKAVERSASSDGVTSGFKRARLPKSSLQQQVRPEPPVIRSKPIVAKTRFDRTFVMSLLPDDRQTDTPAGIVPHASFIDLLALPPHYITEEGAPPSERVPSSSIRGPPAGGIERASPAIPSRASSTVPAPSADRDPPYDPALPSKTEPTDTSGAKRAREDTDDGRVGVKKKARESSSKIEGTSSIAPDSVKPTEWVVQATTCLSKKIDGQVRCFQCIARAIGHGCCFLGVRSFGIDEAGRIVTSPVFRNTTLRDDLPQFDKKYLEPLAGQYNQLMRTWLAPQLAPIIERELKFAQRADTIRARLDLSVHSLCDTCNSSNVGSEWMCTTCGRVACRVCHDALIEIERQEAAGQTLSMTAVESQRRKKCIAKKRGERGIAGEGHRASQFIPMTRLNKKELEQVRVDVLKWQATHAIIPSDGTAQTYLDEAYLTKSPLPDYDKNTHSVHLIPAAELTEAVFLELWLRSQPIVITDIDIGDLKKWTPQYITQLHPNYELQMINNKGTEVLSAKVSYFFGQFNVDGGPHRAEDVKSSFRTKDFPNAKQFKREFRELHDEFFRILPIRNLIHPDGPLNFLAHTPVNAVQPDLGPRAINTWAVDAATGTTLLRTDTTDTATLMYWGHHDEATGRELRIRWDVFRTEDAEGLREFCWDLLSKKLPKGTTASRFRETHDDPLLSPCLYLNQRQREQLFAQKGIKSFPVYQYPGQLVIIPAGCPYQTSSWSDHLSMTVQFLAGPRLAQAIKTNESCRYETKERTLWRQDNVQLETQLLYTWLTCQENDPAYVPTPLDWTEDPKDKIKPQKPESRVERLDGPVEGKVVTCHPDPEDENETAGSVTIRPFARQPEKEKSSRLPRRQAATKRIEVYEDDHYDEEGRYIGEMGCH